MLSKIIQVPHILTNRFLSRTTIFLLSSKDKVKSGFKSFESTEKHRGKNPKGVVTMGNQSGRQGKDEVESEKRLLLQELAHPVQDHDLDLHPSDEPLQKRIVGGSSMRSSATRFIDRHRNRIESQLEKEQQEELDLQPNDKATRIGTKPAAVSMQNQGDRRDKLSEAKWKKALDKDRVELNLDPQLAPIERRSVSFAPMADKQARIRSSHDLAAEQQLDRDLQEEVILEPNRSGVDIHVKGGSSMANKARSDRTTMASTPSDKGLLKAGGSMGLAPTDGEILQIDPHPEVVRSSIPQTSSLRNSATRLPNTIESKALQDFDREAPPNSRPRLTNVSTKPADKKTSSNSAMNTKPTARSGTSSALKGSQTTVSAAKKESKSRNKPDTSVLSQKAPVKDSRSLAPLTNRKESVGKSQPARQLLKKGQAKASKQQHKQQPIGTPMTSPIVQVPNLDNPPAPVTRANAFYEGMPHDQMMEYIESQLNDLDVAADSANP